METLKDFQNDLLNRREIKVVVESEKNPSFSEASKIISKEFKADEESIVINEIKGKFGRKTFLITARVYKTKEDKEKIEPKQKKKEGEEAAAETTPAEQKPAEESPQEENKEEEKKEEAKEEKKE